MSKSTYEIEAISSSGTPTISLTSILPVVTLVPVVTNSSTLISHRLVPALTPLLYLNEPAVAPVTTCAPSALEPTFAPL